ncbi:f259c6c9-da70-49c6-84fe-01e3bffcc061 [Sclerotinia trifoliorum]|uniref:Glycylpeptide N-tetradecanoyltransferase n=1 Tax=Sclerotinia trifoliorum TaxID=28548 RepID=A0A8H2W190_9HELO|nr:f259c6c9-da70-49c6-84fe-01e3bffcc061 [Sclerotinia trifoliorum]
MADDSAPLEPKGKKIASEDTPADTSTQAQVESENEGDNDETTTGATGTPATGKKKKSKRKKIKAALGVGESSTGSSGDTTRDDLSKAVAGLSKSQIGELLALNPALAQQIGAVDGDLSGKQAAEAVRKLSLEDIMTGLASSGKNVKEMGAYKFWQTQPVPKFGESSEVIEEGPFKIVDPEQVPKEPGPLISGFNWVTMDMTSDEALQEVFDLLYGHYVEDDEAMFRFNYSKSFLRWALMSPGWSREWHVGVRATASGKLVAFISAIPVALRVRNKTLKASEVNFLCIHKKLRSKRLAPVLIKEITRRCYLQGTWQAIYTAGVVLPKPVSTCRYYHRSLDWKKLHEVKFSPLPPGSTPERQVRKFALPSNTSTKGLRPMEAKDIDGVLDLLKKYLAKFDMAPVFTREEVEHWLLNRIENPAEQVIWSYVVEDSATKKLTDFFSFYCLESSVIGHPKHTNVRAAYLFYYASTIALDPASSRTDLGKRLNELTHDALIIAKKFKFDVFNALTLMDNTLFLEEQKFGAGDGQLHYYLYNYKANNIAGGVDKMNRIHSAGSGVGVVML